MKGDWGRGIEGIQKLAITILLQTQYHLIPVKKSIVKKKKKEEDNKYWGEGAGKRILGHCWWECKLM